MRKIFFSMMCLVTLCAPTFASDLEDNQIADQLKASNTQELAMDFKLQSFNSCQNMEEVMGNYIKDYWKNNMNFGRGIVDGPMIMEGDVRMKAGVISDDSLTTASSTISEGAPDTGDYSKTNTQVSGVDESDIVKTDGKNTYYFNATQKAIYIIQDLKVVKKINLPKSFNGAELYIESNRLIIISTAYSTMNYAKKGYYINRNTKTYTMIFDVEQVSQPKLIKLYVNDGNYAKSRKIGDYIYVLSNNYFQIPYFNFKTEEDISMDISKIVPRKIEVSKTDNKREQNLHLKGKNLPYNVSAGTVAKCEDIEYLLPDTDTIKKYNFNPGYNIISIINVADSSQKVETKVIAGSNNEIYMSMDNLYLTSNMYTSYDFRCPVIGECFMPYYYRGENTLIHKIHIDGAFLQYDNSTIVPGNPLTQYSMDESDGYFRILTRHWYPERETSLYILDDHLKLTGSLTGLGKTEDYKSSRFIGDKLFLVTYEVIDPLFAIDLANPQKPEILGELKIPGYSSYLHPYDENHLIGLGQSTEATQWGGARTDGLKLDLYEINYDKKCGDLTLTDDEEEKCNIGDYKGIIVKQKYTMNLGGYGSYSEALHNPRMFVWNNNTNLLMLPVQLYKNEDENKQYRRTDFFQGLSVIHIDKLTGISEKGRISHIDTTDIEKKRDEECEKYSASTSTEPVCNELRGGGEYCSTPRNQQYVPEYCFVDSTIGEYIANRSWNFNNSFVKRALYIGDAIISISDDMFQTNDMTTLEKRGSVKMD